MKKHVIFYFTGTGNSRQIAMDLQKELKSASVRKVSEYQKEKVEADTIGIVFPVYDWGAPLIIHEFLKTLNCKKSTYIYAITNFNNIPGSALKQCKEELINRGLKLSAGFLIPMPGNYILWYGANSKKEQEKKFSDEKKKIKEIAPIINAREERPLEKRFSLLCSMLTNHFYKEVKGFHEEDKNFWVTKDCTNCGLCAKHCSVHNIVMGEDGPKWQHHCELCLGCLEGCPQKAIQYKNLTEGKERYMNPTMSFDDSHKKLEDIG